MVSVYKYHSYAFLSRIISIKKNFFIQSDNQASVESVDSCAQAFPSSANNLRSLYDDYRTLASIFMQVGQDFAFPNFAEVQCQVQRVDSYLEETVSFLLQLV